jgi:hypothetical protein
MRVLRSFVPTFRPGARHEPVPALAAAEAAAS